MIITFTNEETKHVAVLWAQTLFEGTEGQNRCVLGVSNLLAIWEENI